MTYLLLFLLGSICSIAACELMRVKVKKCKPFTGTINAEALKK